MGQCGPPTQRESGPPRSPTASFAVPTDTPNRDLTGHCTTIGTSPGQPEGSPWLGVRKPPHIISKSSLVQNRTKHTHRQTDCLYVTQNFKTAKLSIVTSGAGAFPLSKPPLCPSQGLLFSIVQTTDAVAWRGMGWSGWTLDTPVCPLPSPLPSPTRR